LIEAKALGPRALESLGGFLKLVDELEKVVEDLSLEEQAEQMLELSGLVAYYRADQTEKGVAKVENLEEFINAASEFSPGEDLENMSLLSAFLSHVALESGEMQAAEFEESVNLMTLHSAKGLEFPVVFIVGLEEDLFPHYMSIDEPQGLEEERRLCYVGMTRAMKKLYLTYAQTRRLHGQEKYNRPSRFLEEVPEELLDAIRPVMKVSRSITYTRKLNSEFKKLKNLSKDSIKAVLKKTLSSETEYSMGQQVRHKKFGTGTIVDYEGDGESLRLQVKFDRAGTKWLVASFAKLEKI